MSKTPTSKTARMRTIKDEILDMKESPLYAERVANGVFPVIGEGDHDADIMFIGEAPGKNEATTGRPFCGASGRILDELLDHICVDRASVYITNVVKDRPTNNRDPRPDEIALYAPFLDRQIDIIEPRVIATLGRFSMEYIMSRYGLEAQLDSISKIHGKVFDVPISASAKVPLSKSTIKNLTIVPLYHPAVAVYNRTTLPDLKKDFEVLKSVTR